MNLQLFAMCSLSLWLFIFFFKCLLKFHISSETTFKGLIFQLFLWNPKIKGQHFQLLCELPHFSIMSQSADVCSFQLSAHAGVAASAYETRRLHLTIECCWQSARGLSVSHTGARQDGGGGGTERQMGLLSLWLMSLVSVEEPAFIWAQLRQPVPLPSFPFHLRLWSPTFILLFSSPASCLKSVNLHTTGFIFFDCKKLESLNFFYKYFLYSKMIISCDPFKFFWPWNNILVNLSSQSPWRNRISFSFYLFIHVYEFILDLVTCWRGAHRSAHTHALTFSLPRSEQATHHQDRLCVCLQGSH